MKKPTKSTSSNKTQPPRSQRRAAGKSKPVTIDLKAEKVAEATPDAGSKTTSPASSRNGTPKVKKPAVAPTSAAATAAAGTATTKAPNEEKPAANEKSNFGRNAQSSSGKSPAASAKPADKKKQKSSSGRSGRFAAAFIGGGVALGGAALLQYAGILPSPAGTLPTSVTQQVEDQTSTLRSDLQDLTSRLNALETSSGGTNNGDNLAAQVDDLIGKRLADLPRSQGNVDLDAVINQVNETTLRVEKLLADQQANSQALADLQSAISSGAAGSGAAVSALALQVENLASRAASSRDDLSQLKTDLAKLTSQSGSQSTLLKDELESRLVELERQTKGLPDLASALGDVQTAISSNNQSLKQQSAAVERLTANLNKPNSPEKLAARAVAAAALKNDIDGGVPFESSLQILQNLSGEDQALASLKPYAQSGIPTIAQLTASFSSVSENIISAAEPAPSDDLSSRLLAGVKSFVKVKPRKALEGSTPMAIVSRVSQALQDGALTDAAQHWNALPEAGKNVSADWHDQLQSRITANHLISNSVQSFLNSTATQ